MYNDYYNDATYSLCICNMYALCNACMQVKLLLCKNHLITLNVRPSTFIDLNEALQINLVIHYHNFILFQYSTSTAVLVGACAVAVFAIAGYFTAR